MKFKFLNATWVVIIMLYTTFANAGLIEADYKVFGDNLAVYDTTNNLTWLDFTVSRDFSYAESESLVPGWRTATSNDVEALFDSLFGGVVYNGIGSALVHDGVFFDAGVAFITLFGSSAHAAAHNGYSDGLYLGEDNILRGAGVYHTELNPVTIHGPNWYLNYGDASTTGAGFRTSIFLVKDGSFTIEPTQDVPEPSTLAIFALGMIGLASRRFKKQS
jgi:hypothetical protein